VIGERDPVHIEGLAFEPVRSRKDAHRGGDGDVLVDFEFETDAPVPGERQQMIDNVEAFLALRPIDARNVDE
jgi:hypothetical protein